MTHEEARIMSECNRNGIRVYPVEEYGYYRLCVEFNETKFFLRKNIKEVKKLDGRFRTDRSDWMEKVKELYKQYHEELNSINRNESINQF